MDDLRHRVQVCVSFTELRETLLEHFTGQGLNPEIGIDAPALDRYSIKDFQEVAEALHQHRLGVTLHAPFVDLSAGSTDPAIRAVTRRRIEEVLRLVPVFRPRTVVAHAGYDWQRYEYFRETWLNNSVEFWSWAAQRLICEGSRLVLENVYEHRPAEMEGLLERLRPFQVGLCLDCGHLTAFGRASLEEWLQGLSRFIGQIHLHDNLGMKDDHLALGAGRIDFRKLFSFLKSRLSSPPVVTLEMHRAEDLKPSLEYLQHIWPW